MFRLRMFVGLFACSLLLAFVSRPLFTAGHNRLGERKDSMIPESPSILNTEEKSAKVHQPRSDYGKLPIYFEPNLGQTDSQVKFIARGSGATTFLTATEAVFSFPIADFGLPNGKQSIKPVGDADPASSDQHPLDLTPWNVAFGRSDSGFGPTSQTPLGSPHSAIANRQSAISMKLVGANPNARIEGLDRLPGISNYFIGNDPANWRTNIPHYAKVRYRDIYPGIDLVYYGKGQSLEFDLVAAPGANPDSIRMAFDGGESVRADSGGNLIIQTATGEMHLHRPHIYQELGGTQKEVAGSFILRGETEIGFSLGAFDSTKSLTIDPVLSYSTYLGGSVLDIPSAIAVDSDGNAYVTGQTTSLNFPTTTGAFRTGHPGTICGSGAFAAPCEQVFISKINADGTALLYSTYLGGTTQAPNSRGGDVAYDVAVDGAAAAYVTGATESADFPTLNALQPNNNGFRDGFLTKLNSMGSGLIFSTYLGGSNSEVGTALAVDSSRNSYVAVIHNASVGLPTSPTSHSVFGDSTGTLILKVNPTGSNLLYSAIVGSTTAYAIAVDTAGAAYVAGHASETGFPTVNALQPSFGGSLSCAGSGAYSGDAFVAKIAPTGASLAYSTYLGGSCADSVFGIAVDASGNAYVAGGTVSSNFPTTPGAFRETETYFGEKRENHFAAKIANTGTSLIYSTYLPSRPRTGGYECDLAVDSAGQATIVGSTSNPDFPVTDAIQPHYAGRRDISVDSGEFEDFDAYVLKLNSSGTAAVYSTFLGGSHRDLGNAVALDSSGNAYVAGVTRSADFPTYRALQSTLLGELGAQYLIFPTDIFIAKLSASPSVTIGSTAAPFNAEGGNGSIAVSAPAGFTWAAESQADWITITSGSTGTGSSLVAYSVTPLPLNSSPRSGTLIVGGRVFRITQEADDLFVPALLSTPGLNNSFFTSELTLANHGSQTATLQFSYTAASDMGGGTGTATDSLPAGHQRIIPDAIAYLRSLGLLIPDSGSRLGTLRIRVSGVLTSEVGVSVRVTTTITANRSSAVGRVGLSYQAIRTSQAMTGVSFICGLRQNASDRSNVAVQNAGVGVDGDITLRLTVFSGDPGAPLQQALPDIRLAPGEFRQISGILQSESFSIPSGYVKVERISGNAPYYAYGIINDQANSDGSFVSPQRSEEFTLFLPAVVETSLYSSEVIVTNTSTVDKTLRFTYRASAVLAAYRLPIRAGQQIIIPDFISFLRQNGVQGIQETGLTYAGHLLVAPFMPSGKIELFQPFGVFTGVRVSTGGAGGRIGLFAPGMDLTRLSSEKLWLFGLQQNEENRSNLALVSPYPPTVFRIELFDGETGERVQTIENLEVGDEGWVQLNRVLSNYAAGVCQGYARVTSTRGDNPFVTYAVINDGSAPGERTGDGAFIASSP